jgi:hypothetical protein
MRRARLQDSLFFTQPGMQHAFGTRYRALSASSNVCRTLVFRYSRNCVVCHWGEWAFGIVNFAETAQEMGSRFVHISTDAVLDGTVGNYSETDTPNPLNEYAKSKLEGAGSFYA